MQAVDELKEGAHQHGVSQPQNAVAEAGLALSPAEAPSSSSTPDTIEELKDGEKAQSDAAGSPISNPPPTPKSQPPEAQNRVSVARAEQEFAELSRQLSYQSHDGGKLSKTTSKASVLSRRRSKKETDIETDPESSSGSEGDPWDL